MHFEAKNIYYIIEKSLSKYVKITTLILALEISFLSDLNNKFARLTLNVNKIA